ncbi:MAG: hypothetical protein ACR2LN_02300 [Candidatus Levyibacteriota bacterium]
MTLWTTFCPQKISWEITTVHGKGEGGDANWLNKTPVIEKSLRLLREAGISGIRLVIYPNEVTKNGKKFAWQPVETMLDLCKKYTLLVDLCVGPFQYPNYPGIYLPVNFLEFVHNNTRSLDTTPIVREFGETFLQKQLEHFGEDKRIRGFHFANEWPDKQRVQGREKVRAWISESFMLWAAIYLKEHTTKPIGMNTNIDATDTHKLKRVFGELFALLEDQGRLGFDIYPSQETWAKAFLQKLHRLIEPYPRSIHRVKKQFPLNELYFCEVEAQPWGGGQSWFTIITTQANAQEKVLAYTRHSLHQTIKNFIKHSKPTEVSLWGADFWLSAYELGLAWPLEQVKQVARKTS